MVRKGKRSGGIRLRRRSSAGSSAIARAAVSISRSIAKHASGRPAPRYAATGAVLVSAPSRTMSQLGTTYAPGRSRA